MSLVGRAMTVTLHRGCFFFSMGGILICIQVSVWRSDVARQSSSNESGGRRRWYLVSGSHLNTIMSADTLTEILAMNDSFQKPNPPPGRIHETQLLLSQLCCFFNTFRSHTVDDLVDVLESFASKYTPVCWFLCFSLTLYPSEVKCDASYLPNCCARAPHLQHDCLDEYSSLWRMLWHKVNLWARQKL